MKKEKWYRNILGVEDEIEEVNYKRKRMEVYELFRKNKYKRSSEKKESKNPLG